MCFDAQQGLLITSIKRLAAIIRMLPREKVAGSEKESKEILRAETGMQRETPYVMKRNYLCKIDSGRMVMQTTPPWGTLIAVDLQTRLKKWEVPLGHMLDPKKFPDAEKWGSLNLG